MEPGQGRVWLYSLGGGAALAFGSLLAAVWSGYAASDAVSALGLPALVVGGLVGAWLGGLFVDRCR